MPERDRDGRVLDPLLRADPLAHAPRCPHCWTPPIMPTLAGSDDGRRWPSPCPLGFAPVLVSAPVLWHVPVAIPSATVSMPLFAAPDVATLSTAEGEARTDRRKRAREPSPATQHRLL